MSFSKSFARQPRALIAGEMVAALLVIAAFDFVTGYKIRLLSVYAGPIFVLAWFCGKKWGIDAASSASLTWWYVNWSNGDPILHRSSELTIMRYRARSIGGESTIERRKRHRNDRLVHCPKKFSRQ